MMREGRPHATGQILENAKHERALDRVASGSAGAKPFDRGTGAVRRGRGLAVAIKAVISPPPRWQNVIIAADGSVHATAAPSTWARAPTPR
jgi:CO/xanthine dehydrogenase Mo-binding subunit